MISKISNAIIRVMPKASVQSGSSGAHQAHGSQFGLLRKRKSPLTRLTNADATESQGRIELTATGGMSGRLRACQMNPSESFRPSEKQKSGATLAEAEFTKAYPYQSIRNAVLEQRSVALGALIDEAA